jgi:limonene-1,2-epoxide hydrolase
MPANRRVGALLAATALLLAVALSCSPKPAEVVRSYQQAYNDHDVEKLMALHAEDVSFEVAGQISLQGKEQVRDLAEYDFALNIQMFIDQVETRGDTVRCRLEEKNDWLEAAGIERASYTGVFSIEGGLIRSISAEQSTPTAAALKRVIGPLTHWAEKERPERLAEMMPQGTFVYNGGNARKSLSLVQEWRQFSQRKEGQPAWRKLGE